MTLRDIIFNKYLEPLKNKTYNVDERKAILHELFYDYEPISKKVDGTEHPATSFHNSKAKIRGIFGGNSSSKTYSVIHEDVIHAISPVHPYTGEAIKQPNRGRISVQDFSILEKLIFSTFPGEPSLRNLIPAACLKGGSWAKAYDKQDKILHLANKGTIDFTSYDQDVSKYESVTLDWHHADEEMPENMYAATQARLLRTGGKFWMAVTPLKGMYWAEREIWNKRQMANYDAWFFDLLDNPHLTDQFKKDFIESIPEEQRPARVHGQFPSWIGKIYPNLSDTVHLIDDIPIVDNLMVYPDGSKLPCFIIMVVDPHDRTPTAITWLAVMSNNDIHVIAEGWLKDKEIGEVCKFIKDTEKADRWYVSYRIGDPNKLAQRNNLRELGWTLERDFNKHGIYFRGAVCNGLEIGHSKVREYIKYDINKPVSLTNRPKIYFHKRVTECWKQMTSYQRDEWRSGTENKDPKEKPKEKDKHFPDCIRYGLVSKPDFRRLQECVVVDDGQPLKEAAGWYT